MASAPAARLAELTYTVLLAPPPLRRIANKAIRALLPETVSTGPATVVLNPKDAVVSGALAFGVYEPAEQAFVSSHCTAGTLFIDVGANVGLYTALAAHYVGPEGRVVALEPDPVSRRYLERTIARNYPERVLLHPVAATARRGRRPLFVSATNRGDNRLVPHGDGAESIDIDAAPLDELLATTGLETRHVFLKVDVQGSEGEVIAGSQQVLSRAASVTLLMEFWPEGLRRADVDPTALLTGLDSLGLELYELCGKTDLVAIRDLEGFASRYQGRNYTNIVGFKRSA